MYKRISRQRGFRLANRVKWEIYELDRSLDTQSRPERNYQAISSFIETTEPRPLSTKETALILSTGGVDAGQSLSKVYFKQTDEISLKPGENALKMISRTTPKGEELHIDEQMFFVLLIDTSIRDNDVQLTLSVAY